MIVLLPGLRPILLLQAAKLGRGHRQDAAEVVQPFFDGFIAAARHDHFSVTEESRVTRGAVGYPAPQQFIFAFDACTAPHGTGGNDQTAPGVTVLICVDRFEVSKQVDADHLV